jgi:hypothetical protein
MMIKDMTTIVVVCVIEEEDAPTVVAEVLCAKFFTGTTMMPLFVTFATPLQRLNPRILIV